jgi:hypothetical protein
LTTLFATQATPGNSPLAIARSVAARSAAPVRFFETLHTHDFPAASLIRRICRRPKDNTASHHRLENQFLAVAGSLSELHRKAGKRAGLIPAQKILDAHGALPSVTAREGLSVGP